MSLLATIMPTYDTPRPSQEAALLLECWYHGQLTRLQSECLVRFEGDFLVRDSISSKGDFVLTVFWNGRAVHFQINKDPATTSSSGFLFQFEEEQFENVPDLITFYQTHRKSITRNSGCIITNPVPNTTVIANKTESQSEIEQNYMKMLRPQMFKCGSERSLSQRVLLNETRKHLQLTAALQPPSPTSPVPPNGKPHLSLSDLLSRPLPKPVQSPVKEDQDEYCEMDYDAMEENVAVASSASTITSTAEEDEILDASTSNLDRLLNHKLSLTSLNSMLSDSIISSTLVTPTTSASCQDVSKLHWRLPRTGSAPALPKRKLSLPIRDSGCVADSVDYDRPRTPCAASTSSAIDVLNYRSPFIEPNNRPQTPQLLQKFRQLLLNRKPEDCAELITLEDCRLLRLGRNLKDLPKYEQLNGLSLILLPHGQSVRNDLRERSRSLHYLCVLSILHQAQDAERNAMYDAWIRIARALFFQYGNAFSFLTLISALCSDFVKSVSAVQNNGNSQKMDLETVLLPVADKLLHCEQLPDDYPKIGIPSVQPLLDLLSTRPSTDFLDTKTWSSQVDNLWKWLEEGRNWIKQSTGLHECSLKRNTDKISSGANFLCTEFSLKLLFGSKGYSVDEQKRYDKLAAMADALRERCKLRI